MHDKLDKIAKIIPSLRRYAYALAGTESGADQVLEGALERLMVDEFLQKEHLEGSGVEGCRIVWNETEQQSEPDTHSAEQSLQDIDTVHIPRLLDELSAAERKCLLMFTVGDKSYTEISAIEYMPIATVNKHISNAREAFINRFLADKIERQEQQTPSFEQYSDNQLNALLDNELGSSESARLRSALSVDQRLVKRLERLALVDTLILSHFDVIENAPVVAPTHSINTAYLH